MALLRSMLVGSCVLQCVRKNDVTADVLYDCYDVFILAFNPDFLRQLCVAIVN